MPGDDLHDEAPRASGPRHAAPRKPLLTRLHLPTGKAVALAAMPTAVLMAMGLTPQLAVAKPQPENPFREGPCVSKEDLEAEEEKEAAERAAREEAAEKARKVAEERAEARREAARAAEKRREEAGGSHQAADSPNARDSSKDPEETGGSEDAPDTGEREEDADERHPLDPLGIGEALEDLFTPDQRKEAEEDERRAEKDGSTGSDGDANPDSGDRDARSPAEAVKDGARDTADRVEKGPRDAEKAGENAEEDVPDAADRGPSGEPRAEAAEDQDGKKPFPCVEEKKDPGTDERTPVVLPNQPWYLDASSVTLRGLKYHGVVNLTTANGKTKQALKFTADSIDIGDLHQLVDGPNGVTYHVQAAKGSTSTFRGGTVTMYTEELDGKLFGVIPVVFDPEHPPPLDVPFAVFTDVKIRQAGQFGGNLTIPGLQSYVTQG